MERIHVGGRTYTDPDVLSLIRTRVESVCLEVIKKARELNQRLREMGDVVGDPLRRMGDFKMFGRNQGVSEWSVPVSAKTTRQVLFTAIPTAAAGCNHILTLPDGRVNFSIGHEIVHTYFPSNTKCARSPSTCTDDFQEAT